ncbi:hypothetical protein H6P81_004861 [Aristolochia fimbriata]|uniref:Uncharacterized protein n=1 Tax=Aristolochia fimbriata TaxID=158543 RepID=A0AAV7ESY3_ARIFI|nr:hypothetical protein H6P81_004861 [Aristolochia fimbriata]
MRRLTRPIGLRPLFSTIHQKFGKGRAKRYDSEASVQKTLIGLKASDRSKASELRRASESAALHFQFFSSSLINCCHYRLLLL